jgi:hypothetical protein
MSSKPFLRNCLLAGLMLVNSGLASTQAQPSPEPAPRPSATESDPVVPAPAVDSGNPATAPLPAALPPPNDSANGGSTGNLDGPSLLLGSGPFSGLFGADIGHMAPRASYRAAWFPDEAVQGQGTNLGYVQQDFLLSYPLWQDPANEWSASIKVRSELFHTGGTVLPDTLQPFPDELWDIRFGTSYRHLFDNGWIAGTTVSFGSASDKPFHSINEMTAGVNAFLRVPQGEHNAWLFTLTYSSNSELPIPIPGVAYIWQPSEQFRANLGLPFQLVYRPWEDLTLDFSYMLLTTIHARATYRVCKPVRIYGGFDWSNESYLLAGRVNDDDRFFYYDQRLTAGVQVILSKHALLDFSGGYVFDRFYFEGRSLSNDNQNRIDLGAGPFLAVQVQARW